MTVLPIALQIGLPVLLLVWLAAFPASAVLAYTMHAAATASVLFALGLVAMWVMPPARSRNCEHRRALRRAYATGQRSC